MAAEFQVSCGATYTGTGGQDTIQAKTASIDSTDVYVIRTQTVSTDVAVVFPSATNRIGAVIANTGATNAILVSLDAGSTWPLTVAVSSVLFVHLASGTGTINIKAAASTTTFDLMSA